jgi:hypothetical protein
MANPRVSIKRNLIDKANTSIVAATAGAGFIVIFSLVASITLVGQMKYQSHVITAKKKALTQLKTDISATNSLAERYKLFVGTPQNLLGGNPSPNATGPQDGDNAKIVLDALPSSYDFPALITSLEKVLTAQNISIDSIGGTDDEVAQSAHASSSTPAPIPMPFQISVTGDYASIQNVPKALEASIRPIQVQTVELTGGQGKLTLNVAAQTFYQPAKDLKINTKVIK